MTLRHPKATAPFHPRLKDLDLELLGEGEDDLFCQERVLAWEMEQETNEYQGLIFHEDKPDTMQGEQVGNLFDFQEGR